MHESRFFAARRRNKKRSCRRGSIRIIS